MTILLKCLFEPRTPYHIVGGCAIAGMRLFHLSVKCGGRGVGKRKSSRNCLLPLPQRLTPPDRALFDGEIAAKDDESARKYYGVYAFSGLWRN